MAELTLTPGVMSQIEEIVQRQLRSRPQPFNADRQDQLESVSHAISVLQQDASGGRMFSGPTWLSGISVLDGTITAEKLIVGTLEAVTANTGNLNVTGAITVAASYPATAERIAITSVGIQGFNSTPAEVFRFLTTGAGFIGIGATRVSWNAAGAMSIPVAAIGALTIADIGNGNIGGTYTSNSGSTRFEISPTEIRALSGGVNTFTLTAATGAVAMTGSFTVLSAATGAHIKIDNAGGIAGYSATAETTANRRFLLNAATGAGHLGQDVTGANPGISWDSSGNVNIGGAAFSGGKITATSLSVSTLSAISANLGTITAGTVTGATLQTATSGALRVVFDSSGITVYGTSSVQTAFLGTNGTGWVGYNGTTTAVSWTAAGVSTINASRIIAGTLTLGNSGTINSTGAISGTLGAISLGDLTVTGSITLGSGGKIVDADGSKWDQNGIVLISTGSAADTIEWKYSSWATSRPYSWLTNTGSSSISQVTLGTEYGNGSSVSTMAYVARQASSGAASISIDVTGNMSNFTSIALAGSSTAASNSISMSVYDRGLMTLAYTNYAASFGGRIYPGPESGSYQSSRYLADSGTSLTLGGTTTGGSPANWSAGWAAGGYFLLNFGGVDVRVPFFLNA